MTETADTEIKTLVYKSTPLEDEKGWKSELERDGFTVIRAAAVVGGGGGGGGGGRPSSSGVINGRQSVGVLGLF